jgi:hypothetical protein
MSTVRMGQTISDKSETTKATIRGFLAGAAIGGLTVACIKDDSETVREIGKIITKITTSYYGCKFIYGLFY